MGRLGGIMRARGRGVGEGAPPVVRPFSLSNRGDAQSIGILIGFWEVAESGWKRADSNTKNICFSKCRGSSRSVQYLFVNEWN